MTVCVTAKLLFLSQPRALDNLEESRRFAISQESGHEESQWRPGNPIFPAGRHRHVRVHGRELQGN